MRDDDSQPPWRPYWLGLAITIWVMFLVGTHLFAATYFFRRDSEGREHSWFGISQFLAAFLGPCMGMVAGWILVVALGFQEPVQDRRADKRLVWAVSVVVTVLLLIAMITALR